MGSCLNQEAICTGFLFQIDLAIILVNSNSEVVSLLVSHFIPQCNDHMYVERVGSIHIDSDNVLV